MPYINEEPASINNFPAKQILHLGKSGSTSELIIIVTKRVLIRNPKSTVEQYSSSECYISLYVLHNAGE